MVLQSKSLDIGGCGWVLKVGPKIVSVRIKGFLIKQPHPTYIASD